MVPPDCNPDTADNDALAEQLRHFYVRSHQVLDRVMTAQGASLARTKLLIFIERNGQVRSAELVAAFGQAPRTITEAIDALERDGLVRRDPDPLDRRAKRVSITDAGRQAITRSEPSRRAFVESVFGVLDGTERQQLCTLLDRLNARLDVLRAAEPSAAPNDLPKPLAEQQEHQS